MAAHFSTLPNQSQRAFVVYPEYEPSRPKYRPSSCPLQIVFYFYTKTIGYSLRYIIIFKKKYIVCIPIITWI